jgi:hypothetical protein
VDKLFEFMLMKILDYMRAHPEQVEKLIGLFVQHAIAHFPAPPAERLP